MKSRVIAFVRKIRFQSSEERRKAAEKIVFESEQIACTFGKLTTEVELSEEIRSVLPDLAELLKMGDTTMMTLELSVSSNLIVLYVCVHVCMCVSTHVWVYVYMYVSLYVCK